MNKKLKEDLIQKELEKIYEQQNPTAKNCDNGLPKEFQTENKIEPLQDDTHLYEELKDYNTEIKN